MVNKTMLVNKLVDTRININDREYYVQNCGEPWCLNREDNNVIRFEVRYADTWPGDNLGKERSEVASIDSFPDSVNIEFDFAVEGSSDRNSASWLGIGQWRQSQEAPSGSPPFALELSGEEFRVIMRTHPNDFQKLFSDDQFERDRWYSIRIAALFHPVNGMLNIIRDGSNIVKYLGPLGYFPEPRGGYWKSGIYRSSARETFVLRVRGLSLK